MLRTWCMVFFINDTATTEIYTLSLHDALPISARPRPDRAPGQSALHRSEQLPRAALRRSLPSRARASSRADRRRARSEEHTSELQSRQYLVCRLLLEKKKKIVISHRLSSLCTH